jgi:hypothetical protein
VREVVRWCTVVRDAVQRAQHSDSEGEHSPNAEE